MPGESDTTGDLRITESAEFKGIIDSYSEALEDTRTSTSGDSDLDMDGRNSISSSTEISSSIESDSESNNSDDVPDQEQPKPHFFEGVEKLLEVWFARTGNDKNNEPADLRRIGRNKIISLLRIVKCDIISEMHNEHTDSYVLSESSLFVSRRRFILKTCGTTTPLLCLQSLLKYAREDSGFHEIEDVFYSRKNYSRPELQVVPHRSFKQEVKLLDEFFVDGSGYCLGTLNRDCWYLYTLNSLECKRARYKDAGEPDQTLEILMTDLDPDVMKIFTKKVSKSGEEATRKSGIDRIIPNANICDHMFKPCGYSMNGLFKTDNQGPEGSYMTIHITPEPHCSYVSFETNVSHVPYKDVIVRVLETFKPGKFVVTMFANKASQAYVSHSDIDRMVIVKEWLRRESQFCHFKNYDLTYALYTKFPS